MSQFNFGNLSSPLSGAALVDGNLEPWRDALHSSHSGSSRPSYAVAGMFWLDTTTTPYKYNFFDGSDDILIGTINATTNSFTPSGGTLDNTAASTAPTINEDSADGYTVGSVWIDTTADIGYLCVDNSAGAAIWQKDFLSAMAANTVKANATAGSARPTDIALSASTILGRGSSGNIAAITLGAGLVMTGTVLSATGADTGVSDIQTFTSAGSTTWNKPAGYNGNAQVLIEVWGAGGGAGVFGGGNGGGGGNSSFGTHCIGYGGNGGSSTGGAGGGYSSGGSINSSNDTGNGEGTGGTTTVDGKGGFYVGGGGGGYGSGSSRTGAGNSVYGGGGGASTNQGLTSSAGTSVYGGAGGGASTNGSAPGGGGGGMASGGNTSAGGGGGSYKYVIKRLADLGSTETVTVGAGGAGGFGSCGAGGTGRVKVTVMG